MVDWTMIWECQRRQSRVKERMIKKAEDAGWIVNEETGELMKGASDRQRYLADLKGWEMMGYERWPENSQKSSVSTEEDTTWETGEWAGRETKYVKQFTDSSWIKRVGEPTEKWMELQIRRGHSESESDWLTEWRQFKTSETKVNSLWQWCKSGRCGRGRRLGVIIGREAG